jgi:prepilin-type N-terminal cleavage/methylation domain-containing protein
MEGSVVRDVAGRDRGFTLIEMVFTMAILALLLAIGVPGWRAYQRAQEQSGSARTLVSFLRDAQVRAVSEEVSYKAAFAADGKSVTLQRFNGSTYVDAGQLTPTGTTVTYSSPAFTQTDGSTQSYAIFRPGGSATPGSVKLVRRGSSKIYTVTVEGLTGRVSQ